MAEPITNVLGIVGMENKGAYDADTYYEKLNIVSYQGSSYCALDSVHNVLPTDTTKWQLIAEKGDKGDTGEEGYTPIKGTDYYTAEDIAELESTLSDDVTNEVTEQLEDLVSATPLAASSVAGMTDTTRIYVNTTDGHWYWYDGNDWQDGGTYQATEISENNPIIEKINSQITNIDEHFDKIIEKNKFDGSKRVGGYNTTTGEYDSSNTNIQCNTNPVIVTPNTVYYISDNGSAKNAQVFLYKADGTFIEWIGAVNKFTTPSNCGLVNFYAGTLSDKIMISNTADLTYEKYNEIYKLNIYPATCFDTDTEKNKFDGLYRSGGYNTTTGVYDGTNQSVTCNTNPVKVKPNTKYYASNNGVAANIVTFYYQADGTFISYNGAANNFTTPSNCYLLNFYSGSVNSKTMISESDNLTFEAYKNVYLSNTNPNNNVLTYISQNIKMTQKNNYKIVNIGDSLWGNYEGKNSLSGIINDLIGATTYNCGFGGCRMTQRLNDGGWNAFSMVNLADSIAANDFTMQDNAISDGFIGMPDYFPSHLNTLKSIDFSEIDILTIGFGVNDYMGGKYVENTNNKYDKDYINGALRYSIETIQTAYPNLCIVVVSPNFAVWFQNGVVWKTSDEPYYNNSTDVTLPDVVNGEETVAREYKCKFINVYFNSGNNRFTALNNFNTTDGVHPNENGRKKMGTYIAYNLLDQ